MPRVSVLFFKAVIQAVLLFRSKILVVTTRMGKSLGVFWTHMAILLTGQLPHRTNDGKWRYTLAAAAREVTGFLMMEESIRRHQNTIAEYIAKRSLLDLCEG